MIFAPRSCPSRPGFAMTTRILPRHRRLQYMSVQLTVVGCSPAWPNPGGAQSGLPASRARAAAARLRPGRARAAARARGLAARGRNRDHALAPRPLGRPRARGSGARRSGSAKESAARALGAARRARAARAIGERLGRPEMFERGVRPARVRGGRAVRGRGLRADAAPGPPLHAARLRLPRLGERDASLGYSGDSGPSESLAEHRPRRRPVRLRGDARARPKPEGGTRGHLSADEALEAFEAAGAKRLLLTHRPLERPLENGFELAHDGLEIEVWSSARSGGSALAAYSRSARRFRQPAADRETAGDAA